MLCSLFGRASKDDTWSEYQATPCEKWGQALADNTARSRVEDLRSAMRDVKVDWYVIPSEDEHQSEWVGASEKRREWISGFSGSAGQAVVSSSQALLFVDSRYWVQAARQVDASVWKVVRVGDNGAKGWADWLAQDLEQGARVGIDPALLSYAVAESLKSRLAERDSALVFPVTNLVDMVNRSRPSRSLAPINHHPLCLSGESTPSKLAKLRKTLPSAHHIYVLPVLPSIAWLLNFRCQGDIPFVPVAYAYVAVSQEKCVIFVDSRKVESVDLRKRWAKEGVEIRNYGLDKLVNWVREQGDKVKVMAPTESSYALVSKIGQSRVELVSCPVERAKAIKNETELQGFRNAYLRDGRATIRWMAWLDQEIRKNGNKVGEWEAGEKLNEFRSKEDMFAGLAYENISASGPNGALPHYSPEKGKDRIIDTKSTYVIDAGAQYRDGTIDTTRTLFFGRRAPQEMKRAFTRVLQGHIAIDSAVFPSGVTGEKLDILARRPLWHDRKDFGHGVGHGIGSFLAVHEGPCGIPKPVVLDPGHVISNEPGYYLEGQWGIRIESTIACKVIQPPSQPGGKAWLGWERVTQVPIQRDLVDERLLSADEKAWLKAHNAGVRKTLMPLLQGHDDAAARKYLKRACR